MVDFFQVCKGMAFIPWSLDENYIDALFQYFDTLVDDLQRQDQKGFKKTIKYLKSEYFTFYVGKKNNENPFGPPKWNHYADALNSNYDCSSNVSESINSKLNRTIFNGYKTEESIFQRIQCFSIRNMKEKLKEFNRIE